MRGEGLGHDPDIGCALHVRPPPKLCSGHSPGHTTVCPSTAWAGLLLALAQADACDFHCCPAPCLQPCDLEGLMSRLDQEFTFYGLTLKGLLAAGKEIHWR